MTLTTKSKNPITLSYQCGCVWKLINVNYIPDWYPVYCSSHENEVIKEFDKVTKKELKDK